MNIGSLLTILSIVAFILIIIFTILIFITVVLSKKIINFRLQMIKEKRKNILNNALQDLSLYIQLCIPLGITFILYSLSLTDVAKLGWGLMGLVMIIVGLFLLFWRYEPIKIKLREQYK